MNKSNAEHRLEKLYNSAEEITISNQEPIVIFSDLHLGNGSKRDDFRKNSLLVQSVLDQYYAKKEFNLFLNGDVEELLKFRLNQIHHKWNDLYRIFDRFNDRGKFYKLTGNHDPLYYLLIGEKPKYPLYNSILLHYGEYSFFIYHGHQSSAAYSKMGKLIKFFLYFFARPLNIKNFSRAFNDEKKSAVEWNSYQFSQEKQIISIIGHSHRPLFESLSRKDTLIVKMEQQLRDYRKCSENEQLEISRKIRLLNNELSEKAPDDYITPLNSLYSSGFVKPCLFNSGCTIGKRGITCLEINKGKISLVHWFDKNKNPGNSLKKGCYQPQSMKDTPFYKIILKKDDLSYISDCIKLLS